MTSPKTTETVTQNKGLVQKCNFSAQLADKLFRNEKLFFCFNVSVHSEYSFVQIKNISNKLVYIFGV